MPLDIVVTDAMLLGRPGVSNMWVLATEVTDDTGIQRAAHMMPEETLEWRVAEYGIDPDDKDTLLQVVLYEPHLSDASTHPRSLWNADSVDDARAFHVERINQRRGTGRLTTRNRRDTEHRPTLTATAVGVTGATGGVITLGFGPERAPRRTAPLSLTATPEAVKAALEAIPGMPIVKVTGGPVTVTPWMITFTGPTSAGFRVTADGTGLTGPNPHTTVAVTADRGRARVLLDNDTHPDSPLDMVGKESPIDHDLVAVRREIVVKQRNIARGDRTNNIVTMPDAQLRRRPNAEQLRAMLNPVRRNINSGRV